MLVKEFTRSAADARMPKAKDMRTELCLAKTVEYLLKEWVPVEWYKQSYSISVSLAL